MGKAEGGGKRKRVDLGNPEQLNNWNTVSAAEGGVRGLKGNSQDSLMSLFQS